MALRQIEREPHERERVRHLAGGIRSDEPDDRCEKYDPSVRGSKRRGLFLRVQHVARQVRWRSGETTKTKSKTTDVRGTTLAGVPLCDRHLQSPEDR